MADFMGIMGGALICTRIYGIESHFYWANSEGYVKAFDVIMGLVKATFFGMAIALVSCHRGLNSTGGAEGVGRASTESFVTSFVVILVLDFFLTLMLLSVYDMLFGNAARSLV